MAARLDRERGGTQITVLDFSAEGIDPRRVPGTVVSKGETIADGPNSVFEKGGIWTNLFYRSIPVDVSFSRDLKLFLGTERILYTRVSDLPLIIVMLQLTWVALQTGSWKKAGYRNVQVALPQAAGPAIYYTECNV